MYKLQFHFASKSFLSSVLVWGKKKKTNDNSRDQVHLGIPDRSMLMRKQQTKASSSGID